MAHIQKSSPDFIKPSPKELPENLCMICGGPSLKFSTDYYYCNECDYWYSSLPLDIENTSAPESEYELVSYEHTRASNYKRILNELLKMHPPGSRLLEIGCADGLFLKLAQVENKYSVLGIEPNSKMMANNPYEQPIESGYFPDVLDDKADTFDIIVLNCVFEHVPTPRDLIDSFKKHLKQAGTIVINVPVSTGLMFPLSKLLSRIGITYPFNRLWQKDFVSPHVHFFSKRSISKLFQGHGLNLIRNSPLSIFSLGGIYARLSIDPNSRMIQKLIIVALLYCYYPIASLFPDSRVFFFKKGTDII